MKPFLTLICAATLVGAPFAAQSAPAGDTQRVVAELLRMAQESNAAGDSAMARALAEQAARMMGGPAGAPAALALAVPGQQIQLESFAPPRPGEGLPQSQDEMRALELSLMHGAEVFTLAPGHEFALRGADREEAAQVYGELMRVQGEGFGDLQALGYTSIPAAPAQDDLQANLRAIRQELQALRAEVGALRAEIANRNAGGQFFGGGNMMMPAPNGAMPQGGYMFYGPGQPPQQGQPGQQPQHFYFREGTPMPAQQAPAAGPFGPGGGGGWQRSQASAETQAEGHAAAEVAAVTAARDAQAAAHAAHQAHDAALQALHGALGGAAQAFPPPAPPATPAAPAVPSHPRSGGGSRPQNLR